MDADRFDALTLTLTASRSRRVTLGGLVAGVLVALGRTRDVPTVLAKKKRGKGKKGKAKKKSCSAGNPIRCGRFCCRPDERCRGGQCVSHCEDGEPNFGETDTDCGGTCRSVRTCRLGKSCAQDADCFNNVCTGNLCAECRIDSDCDGLGNPLRFRCFDNFCFECATNFDCPRPGQGAKQTVCINKRCVECASGADCPIERPFCMTDINEECVDNAVRPCACRACRDEVDCAAGQVCDESNGNCVECVQDADCATAGQVCLQNTCRTPATCAAGLDLCTQGFGAGTVCGGNCRCHTTTESETRCVSGLESSCDAQVACTSRGECEARHGPGTFCIRDTGNFCGCAFCAAQCAV
jgi:hypothetical protein